MDLDAYCRRVGLSGLLTPDLETLRRVILQHATTIPFENIDVLLGRGISLTLTDIETKLVHERRGGYCFEQNALLMAVLEAIGFEVTALAARVRLQLPRDVTPPRTHMCLRVEIEGIPWLADVGVGSLTPTAPLRLDQPSPQSTPHEVHRIVMEHGRTFHQALLTSPDAWTDVYELTGETMPLIDREIANWWTSTSPRSKFAQNLLVARAFPDGTRIGIQNQQWVHRRGAEVIRSMTIETHAALLDALAADFGLTFPAAISIQAPALPWASGTEKVG